VGLDFGEGSKEWARKKRVEQEGKVDQKIIIQS